MKSQSSEWLTSRKILTGQYHLCPMLHSYIHARIMGSWSVHHPGDDGLWVGEHTFLLPKTLIAVHDNSFFGLGSHDGSKCVYYTFQRARNDAKRESRAGIKSEREAEG